MYCIQQDCAIYSAERPKQDISSQVTHNRRHFPSAFCGPVGVKIVDPDMFLVGTLGLTGQKGWNLIEAMAFDTLNPPLTPDQVAQSLGKSVPRFVQVARDGCG